MEKRLLVTLLACFLFTFIYMKVFIPPPPEQPSAAERSQNEALGTGGGEAAASSSRTPEAVPFDVGDFQRTEAGVIEIPPFENEFIRVAFSNRGAAVTQVWLKHYYDTDAAKSAHLDDPEHWVKLFPEPEESFGNALTLRELKGEDGGSGYQLDRVNWEVSDDTDGGGTREITFRYRTADGLEFQKRITCEQGNYFVGLSVGVRGVDENPRDSSRKFLLRAAGGMRDVQRGQWTTPPEGVAMVVGRGDEMTFYRKAAPDLEGDPLDVITRKETSLLFAGCSNLYFAALLAPDDPSTVTQVHMESASEAQESKISSDLVLPLMISGDGSFTPTTMRFYLGPKDTEVLEEQGLSLFVPLIEEDYGTMTSLRWINELLIAVLHFFFGYTGNWGVAIILMTILVRLTIFPITRSQQLSMQRYSQKVQKLKPKLDALKEKYKDKPKKFAEEQMKIFKKEGVRPPLYGCLSMFITFPVFIGMFQILRTSIYIRQAPFVSWIQDLSLPDALFTFGDGGFNFNLLPILATFAIMGQMMLAPKPSDPQARQQQKIMLFMPIVFGFLFYSYAAGLSLYMLTSSLWGIMETKIIRRKLTPDQAGSAGPDSGGSNSKQSGPQPPLKSKKGKSGKARASST